MLGLAAVVWASSNKSAYALNASNLAKSDSLCMFVLVAPILWFLWRVYYMSIIVIHANLLDPNQYII